MYQFSFISDLAGNGSLMPTVHGAAGDSAGSGWVGLLDILLGKMASLLESGASFELFPGIKALATNVHPLIVHFPIAFLTTFFLLELVGVALRKENLRQTASWMLYFGAAGALGAVAAGLLAEDTVPHGEAVHEIMEWHGRLGISVAVLASILAAWRLIAKGNFSPMAKALHLYVAALMLTCLFFGADLGGLMVYQHGVGVKSLQEPDDHHHHDTVSRGETGNTKLPEP